MSKRRLNYLAILASRNAYHQARQAQQAKLRRPTKRRKSATANMVVTPQANATSEWDTQFSPDDALIPIMS